MGDLQRTAEHWAKAWENDHGLHWTDLVAVRRRLNRKVSGDEAEDWLSYTLRRYFADRLPLPRCYSLGCGHGEVERQLAQQGAFDQCEASDLSEGALTEARRLAAAEGLDSITYKVRDGNSLTLLARTYDAIWAHASLHHFARLEHIFTQVVAALKPGGLFILHEYVGPNRFQFPARQRQIIQACNDLLPDPYRRIVAARLRTEPLPLDVASSRSFARRFVAKLKGGDLLSALWRRAQRFMARQTGTRPLRAAVNLPTAASVTAFDPSEAVRSAEIVPVLRQYFDIVEYKPLGGAILQFLLADIAGNFQEEVGRQWLEILFAIEDALLASGDLQSDFAYIVARPRNQALSAEAKA